MRMTRQFSGQDLDNPYLLRIEVNYLNGYDDRLKSLQTEKLWLYDQQGTITSEQVIAVARYCAVELNITAYIY
jgi:twinkle protein